MTGTTVTCQDADGNPAESVTIVTIEDDYMLVCDGTCYLDGTVVHRSADGTQTHIITVRGIRPGHPDQAETR